MTEKEIIDKIFEFCQQNEDKYSVMALKQFDKDNLIGYMTHNAESCAYTKVRWFLEGLLEKN